MISSTADKINWQVKVTLPNNESATEVTVSDGFTGTPYDQISLDSSSITILDESSSVVSDADVNTSVNNNAFTVTIKNNTTDAADFFSQNMGKEITIRYSYNITSDVTYCKNTANAVIKFGTESVSDSAWAEYKNGSLVLGKKAADISKFDYGDNSSLKNSYKYPLGWAVSINNKDFIRYENGKSLTITDVLPEGYTFIPESAAITAGSPWYYSNFQNASNKYSTETGNEEKYQLNSCLSTSYDEATRTITATITLNDLLRTKILSTDQTLYFGYLTEMTDEEYAQFSKSAVNESYTNTVSAAYDGSSIKDENGNISVQASQSVSYDPTKLLTKSVTTRNDGGIYYADYTVTVNKDAAELNGGNNYTLSDILGKNLEAVPSTVSITPSTGSASYNANTNKLTLTLADSTAYTVTYSAKITRLSKYDSPLETDSDFETKIFDLYGNTISYDNTLGFADGTRNIRLTDGYRSDSWSYGESKTATITISGTKTWADSETWLSDTERGGRPKKIEISIIKTKYDKDGNEKGTETITEEVDVPANEQGSWSYTISGLKTLETDGSTYSYELKEVTVDGYSAGYQLTAGGAFGTDTPNDLSVGKFDITRTAASAITPVNGIGYGDLTVKSLSTDSADFDISICTIGTANYEFDKNSKNGNENVYSKNGKTFTFRNIPLYTYDAADTATEIEYIVSGKNYNIGIKNTFTADDKEYGSAEITKQWLGDNEDESTRPSSISISIYKVGSTVPLATKTISTSSDMETVRFDKLPLYTYSRDASDRLVRTPAEYYITEASADAAKLNKYTAKGTGESNKFTLTEDITLRDVLAAPKKITFTNTYDPTGELKPDDTTSVSSESVTGTTPTGSVTGSASITGTTPTGSAPITGTTPGGFVTGSAPSVTTTLTSAESGGIWTTTVTTPIYIMPSVSVDDEPEVTEDFSAGAGITDDGSEHGSKKHTVAIIAVLLAAMAAVPAVIYKKRCEK